MTAKNIFLISILSFGSALFARENTASIWYIQTISNASYMVRAECPNYPISAQSAPSLCRLRTTAMNADKFTDLVIKFFSADIKVLSSELEKLSKAVLETDDLLMTLAETGIEDASIRARHEQNLTNLSQVQSRFQAVKSAITYFINTRPTLLNNSASLYFEARETNLPRIILNEVFEAAWHPTIKW